jgi:hypothetical protein
MTISSEGNNWFKTIFLCLDSQYVNHDLQIKYIYQEDGSFQCWTIFIFYDNHWF